MVEFIQPFDFQRIIFDYFLGGYTLFPYVFIIFVSGICAYLRITTKIFLILLVIGSFMFSFILGQAYYVLILLIFGFVTFKSLSKIFE